MPPGGVVAGESATTTVTVTTAGAAQTRGVGAALAPHLRPGDVVLLDGPLGAGKTALVQGAAAALGVEETVTSPTFVLVASYATASGTELAHVDLYRLDRLAEVVDLGLDEMLEEGVVALVEWGARAQGLFGVDVVNVVIDVPPSTVSDGQAPPEDRRRISISAPGPAWAERWPALRRTLAADHAEP